MSYTVGQVVKVFRWASAGYGRVRRINNKDPAGTHTVDVVQKDGWTNLCCVKPEDLKPGTKNDERKMIAVEQEIERRRENIRIEAIRIEALLQKLAEEPVQPLLDVVNTDIGTLFFGQDLSDPEQEMQSLRLMDGMSRAAGMTSGYCGCKRAAYTPGERVRPRTGMSKALAKRFSLKPNMTGTVAVPGDSMWEAIAYMCEVSPLQPKAIPVIWDGKKALNLIYVTELELL